MARDDAKIADFDKELEDWCFEADDHLKRQDTADFLTSFLVAESAERSGDRQRKGEGKSYVLNLNAEWGAGKTTFLKCWRTHLRTKQHPVVYVDAWRHDFCQDPLAVLLSDIQKQLLAQVKGISGFKNRLDKSFEALKPIALEGLAALVKGGAHWFAGEAGSRFAGIVGDAVTNGLEGMADVAVRQLLAEQQTRVQAMAEFQSAMAKLTAEIAKARATQLPVFIFVDELDRCRPTYAVEMLELIKHLFDIPNWVFVIATDTDQLKHTVAGLYGAGFNGSKYLERFFHNQYHLAKPEGLEELVRQFLAGKNLAYRELDDLESFPYFVSLLRLYDCSLHKQIKLLGRFVTCLRVNRKLNHFMLLSMIVVYEFLAGWPDMRKPSIQLFPTQDFDKVIGFDPVIEGTVKVSDLVKMVLCKSEMTRDYVVMGSDMVGITPLTVKFRNNIEQSFRSIPFETYNALVKLSTNFSPSEEKSPA